MSKNNVFMSMALKAILPQVRSLLGKAENKHKCYRFLAEQKDKIELLDGEEDVIAVVTAGQGNIVLSVCTVNDQSKVVRTLYSYDFDEIIGLLQEIISKSNGSTDLTD